MGAALLVVPGLAAAWLWVAPRGRARRACASCWPAARRWSWSAARGRCWWRSRPAADARGSRARATTAIWSLIVGYNGLGRVDGQAGGPAGGAAAGRRRRRRRVRRRHRPAAPARRRARRAGGLAARLRARRRRRAARRARRLRRADARTGWLIAVGGAFARLTAVAFSSAKGIFHPYYVSLLAPFTAALVGAGVGAVPARASAAARLGAAGDRRRRASTELVVLDDNPARSRGLPPRARGRPAVAAAVALAAPARRVRAARSPSRWPALLLAPGDLGGADARARDQRDVPRRRPGRRGRRRRRRPGGGRRGSAAAARPRAAGGAAPAPRPAPAARRHRGGRPAAACSAATPARSPRRSPT